MVLHIGAKLCALGLVAAALITAFSAPRSDGTALAVTPRAQILDAPREPSALTAAHHGPVANPKLEVRATGYNSMASQTDGNPHVTATGTRTRFGVLAVSRDLLDQDVPYGSLVRLRDLGSFYEGRNAGRFQTILDSQDLFVVEDTMHARKSNQVDVWFSDYASAVNWGVRRVQVEVVRYGYDGQVLDFVADREFRGTPRLLAGR